MSKKQLSYTIWVEKYRPETVNQVLLPPKVKSFFLKMVEEGEVPNLLLYSSSPGVGKTTVAKALVNEIRTDYIYINMSLERGIDTLRNKIAKFATTYSMFGDNPNENAKKICVLDEFDGSTPELQAAMRVFMEEFQDSCRFILICNYITKIIGAIQSRCQPVDFNMADIDSQKALKPIIVKRLCGILKFEKIEHKVETIQKLVETFYPDIRKMINLLQQYSKTSGVIDQGVFNIQKVDSEFYDMILNRKLTEARKYVIERNYNFDEMYRQLFDNFVPLLEKSKQAQAILIIAEYAFRSVHVIDKEISFTACLLELMSIL